MKHGPLLLLRRGRGFGCVLAVLLCVNPLSVSSQALPSTPTGINVATPSYVRSVQSLGAGKTAVRYIAANSISAPAGSSTAALMTRSAGRAVPAVMRSGIASTAIRTVCVERRACLVALAAAGVLGTLSVYANVSSEGEVIPTAPTDMVRLNMLGYPEAVWEENVARNTEGNGVTATSISYSDAVNANSVYCLGYNDNGCRHYEILLEGRFEEPATRAERQGRTWSEHASNRQYPWWTFSERVPNYVYPDAWTSVGTKISCSSSRCLPTTNHENFANDLDEVGTILLDPSRSTITNDRARHVMEQTNMEPAKLGESATGRAVYTSLWDIPPLPQRSYLTDAEVIAEGLDRWGATDPAGEPIGEPDPGWNPDVGEGLSDPQPSPGYTSDPTLDPDLASDPETGGSGGSGQAIPQPPYDVNVINVDDDMDIDNEPVPESESNIPSRFSYGSRWLPSSCPADQAVNLGMGTTYINFDPICSGFNFMSYIFVSLALVSAGMFVFRSGVSS